MIRLGWYDENKEITYGFGGPCTFFLSPKGFYAHTESYFFAETNTDCIIMRWSKATFKAILAESHDLAQWTFYLAIGQLYSSEMKTSVIKGTAQNRYENLINNPDQEKLNILSKRPDLLQSVSSKVLASYLGVSPSYLSHIRKKLLKGSKSGKKAAVNGAKKPSNSAIIPQKVSAARKQKISNKGKILNILAESPFLPISDIALLSDLSVRSVKYYLQLLKEEGKVIREGNNRSGHWKVIK